MNVTKTTDLLLGKISAHIPGDLRYFDTMLIVRKISTGEVHITLEEGGACGGMDSGRSDSTSTRRVVRVLPVECTARDLVKMIKSVINSNYGCSLIKRYGKPSKRFCWTDLEERGLNAKNVSIVLSASRWAVVCNCADEGDAVVDFST